MGLLGGSVRPGCALEEPWPLLFTPLHFLAVQELPFLFLHDGPSSLSPKQWNHPSTG